MDIVIVDDTPTNVMLMQALVGQIEGTRPLAFTDPIQALAWCQSREPDLIIVDYMMPELDGIAFLKRMRQDRPAAHVPMLMVTADQERDVRYAALASGATDFLTKPIDRLEFLARVKNMLTLRRNHLALTARAASLEAEVRQRIAQVEEREKEIVLRLSRAAEFRDPHTGAHTTRVAEYCRIIASGLGLDASFQERILRAAPMHDVGKLATPDHILLKPGPLLPDEYEQIKQHARIGHEILQGSDSVVLQTAALIALTHHERYDGSGYPDRLARGAIPIEGRITAVADVFDALTSERPYKPVWTPARAFDCLSENRGRYFDPDCVDAFLAARDEVRAIRAQHPDPGPR